jgi:hypothetical protein
MVSIYYLYNQVVEAKSIRAGYEIFVKKYEYLYDNCSLQSMIIFLLTKQDFIWKAEECENYILDYEKNKYNKNSLIIPWKFYLSLILKIANLYKKEGNNNKQIKLLQKAALEAHGDADMIQTIERAIENQEEVSYFTLIKIKLEMIN